MKNMKMPGFTAEASLDRSPFGGVFSDVADMTTETTVSLAVMSESRKLKPFMKKPGGSWWGSSQSSGSFLDCAKWCRNTCIVDGSVDDICFEFCVAVNCT